MRDERARPEVEGGSRADSAGLAGCIVLLLALVLVFFGLRRYYYEHLRPGLESMGSSSTATSQQTADIDFDYRYRPPVRFRTNRQAAGFAIVGVVILGALGLLKHALLIVLHLAPAGILLAVSGPLLNSDVQSSEADRSDR